MADTVVYNVPGALVSGGTVEVGTLVATSGVDVGGTLTVSGTAAVTSGLAAGALTVSATGYFGSGLTAGGLAVSGNATVASGIIGGALNVSGNTTITSGEIAGGLTVSGSSTLIGGGVTAGYVTAFSGVLPSGESVPVSYVVPKTGAYSLLQRYFATVSMAGATFEELWTEDGGGPSSSGPATTAGGVSGQSDIRQGRFYPASGTAISLVVSAPLSGVMFLQASVQQYS